MDSLDVLIDRDALQRRVTELAVQIAAAVPSQDLVMVGPLKGAVVFMADLARALHDQGVQVILDFMALSSYGDGTVSRGTVDMTMDLSVDLAGRDVLLVDDIADTGRTLAFARERVLAHGPASLRIAVVLDKPARREVDVPLDFVGFEIPDLFVLGYGADLAQRYRELPFIGVRR
jgi:hypoxanthine phosphoribosyltransferase